MKVICNCVGEGCEGCRHSFPHEPWNDKGEEEFCSESEEECAFHQLPKVKCLPIEGG